MLELPEVLSRAKECRESLQGKTVKRVLPPSSPHKFCWFLGDPAQYTHRLEGKTFQTAEGFGIILELSFSDGVRLSLNDGVILRLLDPHSPLPYKFQLLILFTDGWRLVCTVAMYGGIICHQGEYDNDYYIKSQAAVSPLSEAFDQAAFFRLLDSCKPSMSVKACLATEQRIPGLGNGVLQDILFQAGIHPKRKLETLSQEDRVRLLRCVKTVLLDMTRQGGRDSEKNLFGKPGGYARILSPKTLPLGCPRCGGALARGTYLGGTVITCPRCQPLESR